MKNHFRLGPIAPLPDEDEIAAWVAFEIGRRAEQSVDVMTARLFWVHCLRTAIRFLMIDPLLEEPGYYAGDWS